MASIESVFREYGVSVALPGDHHHARSGWVQTDCPLCSPGQRKFRLGWVEKGFYCSCWVCSKQPPGRTLALLLRVPESEVRKLGLWKDKTRPARQEVHAGVYAPPPGVGPLLKAHKDYLRSRDFNPDELAATWGLQGIGHLGGRFAWRVFIPVEVNNKPASWTTRSLRPRSRRYLAAKPAEEAVPMRHTLYGWDKVTNAAILFEGPADCWAVGPGAVASMGLGYSRRQVALLSRLAVRYLCFDSEPAAQRRAKELARQLAGFPGATYVVTVETAKDAAGATKAERRALGRLLL